jgi:redox-sensitive bicupin YhaK (pirin superfamily)
VNLKLLLGNAFDKVSPVSVKSDLFYLHTHFPSGSILKFNEKREIAIYTVAGKIKVNNKLVHPYSMYLGSDEEDFKIEALENSEVMLLGGESLGERFIYWNFVSSSVEKIEKAKMDWSGGPGELRSRFPRIPSDQQDFIPLPEEIQNENPKGTIM